MIMVDSPWNTNPDLSLTISAPDSPHTAERNPFDDDDDVETVEVEAVPVPAPPPAEPPKAEPVPLVEPNPFEDSSPDTSAFRAALNRDLSGAVGKMLDDLATQLRSNILPTARAASEAAARDLGEEYAAKVRAASADLSDKIDALSIAVEGARLEALRKTSAAVEAKVSADFKASLGAVVGSAVTQFDQLQAKTRGTYERALTAERRARMSIGGRVIGLLMTVAIAAVIVVSTGGPLLKTIENRAFQAGTIYGEAYAIQHHLTAVQIQ
jgi:hypothetical protein